VAGDWTAEVVVVFAGGPPPAAEAVAELPEGAFVVAADRGADHALAAGFVPDLVVGDLDSISPEGLARSPRVERHPVAKDATDLALALDAALARSPRRLVVIGGADGRLDHLLAELLLLGSAPYGGVEIDALLGEARVHVVRGTRSLTGVPGELISLFALHGPARGVVTEGLRWALRGDTLDPGSSRGVSNEFAASEARVDVSDGVVLAVRPNRPAEGSLPAGNE
jgi:thiamine pyrophosphokinase